MPESFDYSQQMPQANTKIIDIEERLRLLKDRVLLLGKSHIEEREEAFKTILELKKDVAKLKEENLRILEAIERITEKLNNTARKEDFTILQRQFDLFRK